LCQRNTLTYLLTYLHVKTLASCLASHTDTLYTHAFNSHVICCLIDAESVAESTGSRNLPERSASQTSVMEHGDAANENQNNGMVTSEQSKKRPKNPV